MTKLRLEIELDYDMDLMHADDADGHAWFMSILKDPELYLHSNEIGDEIGHVTVVKVINPPQAAP